jgi:Sec-independent protein translocase protein TatA
MIIIIGLIILIAAVIAGVAGILSNSGGGHSLTHHFAVFGYHVTGSTGTLFLYGIVVGALGLFGLSLLLAGARRTSRRGREARRGLSRSRRETATVSQDRDDLLDQRETARAASNDPASNEQASNDQAGRDQAGRDQGEDAVDGRRGKWRLFTYRSAAARAAASPAQTVTEPAPDVPVDASVAPD